MYDGHLPAVTVTEHANLFRLSRRRQPGVIPVRVLLVVAFLEVAINRVAIGSRTSPGLASALIPKGAEVPAWYELLSYAGLFLFYMAGTLAALLVFMRCATVWFSREHTAREIVAHVALAIAALIAAAPLVIATPEELSFALEIAFALSVITLVIAGWGNGRDMGVQMGLFVVAIPLLVHTVDVLGAHFLWPEGAFDTPGANVARAGVLALCVAALMSPYLFSPRPFARAVTRPGPIIFAMAIAGAGAFAAREWYPQIAKGATLAIGVEVSPGTADPRLALYLLAIATLAWTLSSTAFAAAPARRQIGAGIALIVLGGYAFRWPNHYLLPLYGLALISNAARRVREEELAALPIAIDTPAINDVTWGGFVTALVAGLKRGLGDVHALTTRGDGGLVSTVIIGERLGMPVRTRIERIEGSVIAFDVSLGREIDEMRGATLCIWAVPPRQLGVNPNGPPAAPLFKTGDVQFDQRFRSRGSTLAFNKVFDDGLRARAIATLDGWLAYWEPEGMRYRVYPGRGAPLDHPIPLSDLALGRPGSPERLVAVIELLVELAARGVQWEAPTEPIHLEEIPQ